MSAPADTPPPRDGKSPEAAPAPDHVGPAETPVLSLEDRKAERQRQRAAEIGDISPQQAKLLRMEARRQSGNRIRNGRTRAPDPLLAPGGEVPPLPQVAAPSAPAPVPPSAPAVAPVGPVRRDMDDDDGFQPRPGARLTNPLRRPARAARARARHWGVLVTFLLLVVLPTGVTAWYLWERASPRYASSVGFSVRTEEAASAASLLGGLVGMGGNSSSSDTDILYRYIQSQEIVEKIDARLDLRGLWAKGDPDCDPIFAYHSPGTIEDLVGYWQGMVAVYNDSSTGLLDVEVQAFTPEDAQAISQAIFEESQRLINQLSDIAQSDKTRLAREELDESIERLKDARAALTQFRNVNQLVDPEANLQTQMGLLGRLQDQLAQALIELDLLRESAADDDPRVGQAMDRVDVIQARIADERANLGLGRGTSTEGDPDAAPEDASGGTAFADLVGDYEKLQVDQEFAQRAYIAAMASYDGALAESRQQSRYLAAHVEPTLAQRAEYPQRWELTLLTALFASLAWMMLTLAAYAFRDRR
ncbi:Capsule polysaccharide export inner-membrane protein [Rubellimicrobium mesophilum DSM 19309]|uniref:Capsule polysaccharide export inner-membrane protein n=1 Tax=Rubellimicrobium mesophilum DSM 19309 TaxID=442562 RepID=A0A017HHI2_9RHOB|nr:capsule biosynthesis protein [Rubellimicrobium mesophilum]EYD73957.1 Capsule polysaccharide export inner-membrane protein [Rubellimicrobium mesophilum DSM 19309]